MKKILVPIDYSPNSINALHVAAAIARKSGAVIEMLHVNLAAIYAVPFSEFATASRFEDEDEQYDETAKMELEKIKTELLTEPAYSKILPICRQTALRKRKKIVLPKRPV